MAREPSLDAAYALETPEDNRVLYADWAKSYDSSFASAMDYQLPAHVARFFGISGAQGPVLDVGAGTGLVAQHIRAGSPVEIDALDLSAQMLAVAAGKGIYRRTIEADLTQALPIAPGTYGAVVCSGTFTHGHVGPEVLDGLVEVARPGAIFVLSVNAEHFEARGFEAKFAALAGVIKDFRIETVPIYGPGAPEERRADQGHIALFRKA